MPVDKARKHYLGKDGYTKLNCAQSVIAAFKDELKLDEDYFGSFNTYGGGQAPEGVCGAYYSVKLLLGSEENDKIKDLENYFLEHAGSLKCKEIRQNKKLPCVGCVEASSEYLKTKI